MVARERGVLGLARDSSEVRGGGVPMREECARNAYKRVDDGV